MTEAQKRFVELEKKKDEVRKFYEDLESALFDLVSEQGLNSFFQDEAGTVYKIVECEGKYIKFDKYGYNRTKRPGEERGSLSMKEARERGFKVD